MASLNIKIYDNDGNEIDFQKLFIDQGMIEPMTEDRKRELLKGKRTATINFSPEDVIWIPQSEN